MKFFASFLIFMLALVIQGCGLQGDKPALEFLHTEDGTQAADISADGSFSVVSSFDLGLLVWDLEFNQKIYQWGVGGEDAANLISNVKIAYDSSYVVSSDNDAIALWNLQNGEPEGFWQTDESTIRDIAVANQGVGILVGYNNNKVTYFEPFTGRRIDFLGHQEKINSVDLSPNGYFALTGSNDYVAYLWDTRSGQVVYRFDHPTRVTKVAIDPKGRFLFTADSQKAARIWDVLTGKEVSQLKYIQRQKIFTAAEFSDDGTQLLTGSPNRQLNLWDVQTGELIKSWKVKPNERSLGNSSIIYAVGFYDDGQVISESSSGWAEVWNL